MYAINVLENGRWILPFDNPQRASIEEARKRAADFPVARIVDMDTLQVMEVTGTFAKDMKVGEKAVIIHDRRPPWDNGVSDMVGLTIKRNQDGSFVVLDFDLPESFVPPPFQFTPFPGTILHEGDRYSVVISEDPQPFCPPKWAEKRKTEPKRHIPTDDEKCHCKECQEKERVRASHMDPPPKPTRELTRQEQREFETPEERRERRQRNKKQTQPTGCLVWLLVPTIGIITYCFC